MTTELTSAPEAQQLNLFGDTLSNLVAGLGTKRDKRSDYQFSRGRPALVLDFNVLLGLYQEEWSSAKIVDIIPNEMVREWRQFSAEENNENIKALERAERALLVRQKFNTAMKWARLFGGATIIMGVKGQTDNLMAPLDLNRIRKGDLIDLNVVERPLVNVAEQDFNFFDPESSTFGEPEFFRYANGQQLVHSSRVIVFKGVESPRFAQNIVQGYFWGDSVLNRVYDAVLNNSAIHNAVSSLVTEANVDVIGVTNLSGTLAGEAGTDGLQKRFELAALLKSITQMMVIDASETYERKAINFGGLPNIMEIFLKTLSAATDIPSVRFLGESASGISDTGEHDLRNYYDMIASRQELDMRPQLDKFDQVFIRSALGSFPDGLEYDFVPLWQIDPSSQSQIELQNSQRDIAYLNNNIVTPAMIMKRLKREGVYDISDDDIEQVQEITEFEFDPADPTQTRADPDSPDSDADDESQQLQTVEVGQEEPVDNGDDTAAN